MDGPGTIFLVFLLGGPHLLKGVQGGEDRAPGMEGIQSNIVKEYGDGYSWSLPGPMGPNQTRLLFKGWGWVVRGNQCLCFLFRSYSQENYSPNPCGIQSLLRCRYLQGWVERGI